MSPAEETRRRLALDEKMEKAAQVVGDCKSLEIMISLQATGHVLDDKRIRISGARKID